MAVSYTHLDVYKRQAKSVVKNDYLGARRNEIKKQDIMEKQYAKELVEFIHESPTNFHAVANAKKELLGNGYKQLFSGEAWQIERGGKYFEMCIRDSPRSRRSVAP